MIGHYKCAWLIGEKLRMQLAISALADRSCCEYQFHLKQLFASYHGRTVVWLVESMASCLELPVMFHAHGPTIVRDALLRFVYSFCYRGVFNERTVGPATPAHFPPSLNCSRTNTRRADRKK